jgi:hypothetical protein
MCPACMATIAMLVVSAASTSGVAALLVSKLRGSSGDQNLPGGPLEQTQKEEACEK